MGPLYLYSSKSVCICWFRFHIESAECKVIYYLKIIFTGFITQEMFLCLSRNAEFENQQPTQVLDPELTSGLVLPYPEC